MHILMIDGLGSSTGWIWTCSNISYLLFHQTKTITNHYLLLPAYKMFKHGRRLGNGDHPCILHLEPGKRQLNHSPTNVTAHNIRLLLNKLYRSHVKAENDKTVNPFSSRLMPLRCPKSKKLCQVVLYNSILLYSLMIVHMCACQYACQITIPMLE